MPCVVVWNLPSGELGLLVVVPVLVPGVTTCKDVDLELSGTVSVLPFPQQNTCISK